VLTNGLEGLGMFLVALFVCLLVFSSFIYYAELGQPGSQIDSIPDGFWWAIVTMTTVGYGDKVPVGYVGKLVGSACAIAGVLTLAIPVPIITGHFNRFHSGTDKSSLTAKSVTDTTYVGGTRATRSTWRRPMSYRVSSTIDFNSIDQSVLRAQNRSRPPQLVEPSVGLLRPRDTRSTADTDGQHDPPDKTVGGPTCFLACPRT